MIPMWLTTLHAGQPILNDDVWYTVMWYNYNRIKQDGFTNMVRENMHSPEIFKRMHKLNFMHEAFEGLIGRAIRSPRVTNGDCLLLFYELSNAARVTYNNIPPGYPDIHCCITGKVKQLVQVTVLRHSTSTMSEPFIVTEAMVPLTQAWMIVARAENYMTSVLHDIIKENPKLTRYECAADIRMTEVRDTINSCCAVVYNSMFR